MRRRRTKTLAAILTCSIAAWLPSARALELAADPGVSWWSTEAAGSTSDGVVVNTTANDITVADGVLLTVTTLTSITGIASATHVVRANYVGERHYAFEISGASGSLRAQGGIQLGPTTTLTLKETTAYTGTAGGACRTRRRSS